MRSADSLQIREVCDHGRLLATEGQVDKVPNGISASYSIKERSEPFQILAVQAAGEDKLSWVSTNTHSFLCGITSAGTQDT